VQIVELIQGNILWDAVEVMYFDSARMEAVKHFFGD
jgi:hypothetical protein